MGPETPSRQKEILVLFAHPALQNSRVNRVFVEAIHDLDGVTFHDLYEAYPDFDVDISREQELLEAHDMVVLQHPMFWYSIPPLLKQWIDLVLEHGWAYGSQGTALEGKWVMSAITTGGRQEAYGEGTHNRYTIREFLAPVEQTFALCGMDYLPPFVVNGTHGMSADQVQSHARDYRRTLEVLRDGRLNLDAARQHDRVNESFEEIIFPADKST